MSLVYVRLLEIFRRLLVITQSLKAEMNPKSDALFERLKSYALRIVRLYAGLPNSGEAKILGNQVLHSGTSPGAQYAEARRAKRLFWNC